MCLPTSVVAFVALLPLLSSAEVPVDFNQDIRPLLSGNCLVCHGPDEDERAAGLRLDTQDGSREDLGGYAAVVPGDPDSSAMIERLTTEEEDLRMPPDGKGRQLTASEVDLIRRWIKAGGNYARHWSYEPPRRSDLPAVGQKDWPRNSIDHFILAKLEEKGLHPSPEADRLTLARRLSLDLTGLPPTWDEANAFVDDTRENAYELYRRSIARQAILRRTLGSRLARLGAVRRFGGLCG